MVRQAWPNFVDRKRRNRGDFSTRAISLAKSVCIRQFGCICAEPLGLGQDKTDIIVVTVSGRHVVEVKWLGKNERGTTYAESRIGEGLRQVKIYLDNDDKLMAGYLVVYDARSAAENTSKCQYANADLHAMCARPMIHFLESVSPKCCSQRRLATVLFVHGHCKEDSRYASLGLWNVSSNADLPRHRWFDFKEWIFRKTSPRSRR